jgi:hypothetical protein
MAMSEESSATVEILTADPAEAPLPQPEGLAHSSSPVDLPPPDEPLPHGLRWTSIVIAVATILLALLNATAIRAWAYQLPDNPVAERIVAGAEGWYGFTASLGLNVPVETMHGWWQSAEAVRLGGEEPAAQTNEVAR